MRSHTAISRISGDTKSPLYDLHQSTTTWQGSHVGDQYNRIFSRRIYMKIELSSHQHSRRDIRCRPAIMQNDRFPVVTSYNGLYREVPGPLWNWYKHLSPSIGFSLRARGTVDRLRPLLCPIFLANFYACSRISCALSSVRPENEGQLIVYRDSGSLKTLQPTL